MKTQKAVNSQYVEHLQKEYSLYVLQSRALPHLADGLKPSHRRSLWMARDGHKVKTATLGGAAMKIHPHGETSSAINTLTGPYINNIPLFKGYGAFGTLLNPNDGFAAPRYTSVELSEFCKDVVFADKDIIPMVDSYDGEMLEPAHYLPLVPVVLLNPTEGIAVGFACSTLPYKLLDIVDDQIKILTDKKISQRSPYFIPLECQGTITEDGKWLFEGEYVKKNAKTITVTKLPYGVSYTKFISKLETMLENGDIEDFTDDSKNIISVDVQFKSSKLINMSDDQIKKKLLLTCVLSENNNYINFDGQNVINYSYVQTIEHFTKWRLKFYKQRYERLLKIIENDISRLHDILIAIKHNVGGKAKSIANRNDLKTYLEEIKIKDVDYIADLPVYRFTEQEKTKVDKQLEQLEDTKQSYVSLIKDEKLRKQQFISELQQVKKKYG
jgi:DNA gyrase/topoisomerase IV subunit A